MVMSAYVNDHTRLLDRLAQDADALAAKAAKWSDARANATAAVVTAQDAFTASPEPEAARDLVEAQAKVRDLTTLSTAIEDAGGPQEVRTRALKSPAVFAALAAGFRERIAVLEKLVHPARKRLAEHTARSTEAGRSFWEVQADPQVFAWRAHGEDITTALAVAKFGEAYSTRRGAGYAPEKFDDLYARLTAPLPQAPATS